MMLASSCASSDEASPNNGTPTTAPVESSGATSQASNPTDTQSPLSDAPAGTSEPEPPAEQGAADVEPEPIPEPPRTTEPVGDPSSVVNDAVERYCQPLVPLLGEITSSGRGYDEEALAAFSIGIEPKIRIVRCVFDATDTLEVTDWGTPEVAQETFQRSIVVPALNGHDATRVDGGQRMIGRTRVDAQVGQWRIAYVGRDGYYNDPNSPLSETRIEPVLQQAMGFLAVQEAVAVNPVPGIEVEFDECRNPVAPGDANVTGTITNLTGNVQYVSFEVLIRGKGTDGYELSKNVNATSVEAVPQGRFRDESLFFTETYSTDDMDNDFPLRCGVTAFELLDGPASADSGSGPLPAPLPDCDTSTDGEFRVNESGTTLLCIDGAGWIPGEG